VERLLSGLCCPVHEGPDEARVHARVAEQAARPKAAGDLMSHRGDVLKVGVTEHAGDHGYGLVPYRQVAGIGAGPGCRPAAGKPELVR
jgi:hypothetical protein